MARSINRVTGRLLRVAEDRMVDFRRLYAGPTHRLLAGDGSELHGSKVAELAAVAAHRRARAVHNCNVRWLKHEDRILNELSASNVVRIAGSKPLSVSRDGSWRPMPRRRFRCQAVRCGRHLDFRQLPCRARARLG